MKDIKNISIHGMTTKCVNFITQYKYPTVIFFLLLVFVLSYGMKNLGFVADLKIFFGEDNPQLQELERFEDAFAKHGNIMFSIASRTEKDIFNRETLSAIEELTRASWETPYSSRVNSISNFNHSWAEGDDLIVQELFKNPEKLTDFEMERIRKIALSEPMLVNTLVSVNGDLALVTVILTTAEESSAKTMETVTFSRKLADKIQKKYPNLRIEVSGGEIFNSAYAEVSRADMVLLYPIMFAIMIVMMFFLVPSVSGVFSTLLIILASALTAMGTAGWLGIQLTSASAIAPIIILTLAVADCIHLLVSMIHYMKHGMSKTDAIHESIRVNLQPVFLTSLTTSIGFLTLLTCDSPPFQDLGIIVSIGVGAAFLYSIILLPALMAILPMKCPKLTEGKTDRKQMLMKHLGRMVVNHRKILLVGLSLLLLILSFGLPRLEISDDFVKYFDERFEVRQIADYLEEHIPAMGGIEYLMDSGEPDGIHNPLYLKHVESFTNWCMAQPEVSQATSMLYTIKRLNMNMHGDDPAYRKIPENRELVAQYMLLYEMSLPFGQDMNGSVTPDRSAMRFTVLQKRLTTSELQGFERRADAWLAENWIITAPPKGTGMGIMFAHISERNIKSMIFSTSLALLLISGILIIAFRSVKIGLFSLIPNVIPVVMTFGLWGLFAGYINMAVSYIAAMSMGIVVDDTVHFLSKYMRAKNERNLSPKESVLYSFNTVGQALLTTSLVLSMGFMVLFFSGFEVNAVMGTLMAITIVFALITDFFLLPPLLLYLEGEKVKR